MQKECIDLAKPVSLAIFTIDVSLAGIYFVGVTHPIADAA